MCLCYLSGCFQGFQPFLKQLKPINVIRCFCYFIVFIQGFQPFVKQLKSCNGIRLLCYLIVVMQGFQPFLKQVKSFNVISWFCYERSYVFEIVVIMFVNFYVDTTHNEVAPRDRRVRT